MKPNLKRARAAVIAAFVGAGALVPAAVAVTSAGAAPARLEPFLAQQLLSTAPTSRVVVLVSAGTAANADAAVAAVGLKPILRMEKIGVDAVRATPSQVEQLRHQDGVRYLQGNRPLELAGSTGPVTTRAVAAEQLYRAADGSDLDGSGVGIAVVDSGMAGDHPFYQGEPGYFALPTGGTTRLRNLKQVCVPVACDALKPGEVDEMYFVDETGVDTDVQATGGHGTHVTGIAGGGEVMTANGVPLRGVAPAAALYGIGAGAGLFTLSASASLNWVLEHHADPCFDMDPKPAVCPPIKVVNNSYGSPGEYDPADVYALISERLVLEGVTVVWAAGNGDELTNPTPRPNDGSVNLANPPGQSPLPGVIMVANQNDGGTANRDGGLNKSSSRGEKGRPETYPDVAAPGTSILSSCRPYLPICASGYPDPNYGEISGTSMAAPHVAGVVALLLEARPDLTPGQIEDVLEDTAYKFGDAATYEPDVATGAAPIPNQVRNADDTTSFDKGHGLVDVAAAVAAARHLPAPAAAGGTCGPDSAQATDVSDDAGQVGSPLVSGPNQATLDLESVRFSTDGAMTTLTVTIEVADLRAEADPPAAGTAGEVYDVDFDFAETAFYARADRQVGSAPGFSLRKSAEGAAGTSDTTVGTVTGTFDADADEIVVDIPTAMLVSAVPGSAFTTGTKVTPGDTTAWRDEGALLLAGDVASGSCTFVVGATAEPEPTPTDGTKPPKGPKDPKPEKRNGKGGGDNGSDDGSTPAGGTPTPTPTVTEKSSAYEGVIAEPHVNHQCGGAVNEPLAGVEVVPAASAPLDDPACLVFPVSVESADPYRYLDVKLVVTSPDGAVSDLDLYLFDATGAEVASSATTGSNELLAMNNVAAGAYRVLVQPFVNAPGTTFAITVRTRTAPEPLAY